MLSNIINFVIILNKVDAACTVHAQMLGDRKGDRLGRKDSIGSNTHF